MSRADDVQRRQAEHDRVVRFLREPEDESPPFDPDPDAWESRCAGNKTMHHLAPSAKLADRWRCGSCSRWLKPPRTRTTTKEP